jgi:hypothetical protein
MAWSGWKHPADEGMILTVPYLASRRSPPHSLPMLMERGLDRREKHSPRVEVKQILQRLILKHLGEI